MGNLESMAKEHHATLYRFRGLHVASVSVKCNQKVDIGVTGKERKLLGTLFPSLARRNLGDGLYIYGADVDHWAGNMAADENLCAALRILLKGYAFRIDWTGQRLSARVNTLRATIDGDPTGGERFFSTLEAAASRLSLISERGSSLLVAGRRMQWGPSANRKLLLAASFIVPFALLLVFHFSITIMRLTH